jgi:hypothetical protein
VLGARKKISDKNDIAQSAPGKNDIGGRLRGLCELCVLGAKKSDSGEEEKVGFGGKVHGKTYGW